MRHLLTQSTIFRASAIRSAFSLASVASHENLRTFLQLQWSAVNNQSSVTDALLSILCKLTASLGWLWVTCGQRVHVAQLPKTAPCDILLAGGVAGALLLILAQMSSMSAPTESESVGAFARASRTARSRYSD